MLFSLTQSEISKWDQKVNKYSRDHLNIPYLLVRRGYLLYFMGENITLEIYMFPNTLSMSKPLLIISVYDCIGSVLTLPWRVIKPDMSTMYH